MVTQAVQGGGQVTDGKLVATQEVFSLHKGSARDTKLWRATEKD